MSDQAALSAKYQVGHSRTEFVPYFSVTIIVIVTVIVLYAMFIL
jgi:hypothetical protein